MSDMSVGLSSILPSLSPVITETKTHFAPVNIAFIKYWGKRNVALNLPVTDSLSIALGQIGTRTRIAVHEGMQDHIVLNGRTLTPDDRFYQRTTAYLNHFRSSAVPYFALETTNDVPTGAGLASSASGYAALVLALNELFGWQLSQQNLSILARIGSGSACRSLWQGFVHWRAGCSADGMDSYAYPLAFTLPRLRIGLLTLSAETKPISSRDGMQRTQEGLSLYSAWPAMVAEHLEQLQGALAEGDLARIGAIAEHNALAMHATMLSAYPALCYWLPETLAVLHTLWQARADGLACWATLDAGANVKLIFAEEASAQVQQIFPTVQIIVPFPVDAVG